jgi:uncharacterized membrane protein
LEIVLGGMQVVVKIKWMQGFGYGIKVRVLHVLVVVAVIVVVEDWVEMMTRGKKEGRRIRGNRGKSI